MIRCEAVVTSINKSFDKLTDDKKRKIYNDMKKPKRDRYYEG